MHEQLSSFDKGSVQVIEGVTPNILHELRQVLLPCLLTTLTLVRVPEEVKGAEGAEWLLGALSVDLCT